MFEYPWRAFVVALIASAISCVTLGARYAWPSVREFIRRYWESRTLRRRYQRQVATRNRG